MVRNGCCLSPILFNFYIEYRTKEVLEGSGDCNTVQVTSTVKYANELVLLTKDETVLQGMIDRLIEIRRCCAMGMNVRKTKVMRISRKPPPVEITIDQKQLDNMDYFN
jgi:hypothetical protein